MQRSRRRYVCSAASMSSPSNTSLRLRGRSRTSSAAGDSLAVNSRDFVNSALLSKINPKLRSTKYNMRLLSSSHKNFKKLNKNKKIAKPPISCFQNAIVIAPFHTLKKCFQSKLVDIYSAEKMKKNCHKMRMAKKQNMSFEYDVFKLDEVQSKVKTEKGKKAPVKKKRERSPSYCQCVRTPTDKPASDTLDPLRPHSSSSGVGKRRRLNTTMITPNIAKQEIDSRMISFNSVEPFRGSEVTLVRSGGSWESLSNSSSHDGEHLEGTIAISTTSFDSCLEQFEKESCSFFGPNKNNSQRTPREERPSPKYMSRPIKDFRHMIMMNGIKCSDGHIEDFADREPQTHNLCLEMEDQLKPLKRQSKSKVTKLEADTAENCPRSKTPSDDLSQGQSGTHVNLNRHKSKGNTFSREQSIQIEVGTQVESSVSQESVLRDDGQMPKDPPAEVETEVTGNSDKQESEKNGTQKESDEVVLEDPNEPIQIDLLPRIQAEVVIPTEKNPELQESDFFFRSRRTPSSFGESCDFKVGLNWIFSDDDEMSEHGDEFF